MYAFDVFRKPQEGKGFAAQEGIRWVTRIGSKHVGKKYIELVDIFFPLDNRSLPHISGPLRTCNLKSIKGGYMLVGANHDEEEEVPDSLVRVRSYQPPEKVAGNIKFVVQRKNPQSSLWTTLMIVEDGSTFRLPEEDNLCCSWNAEELNLQLGSIEELTAMQGRRIICHRTAMGID